MTPVFGTRVEGCPCVLRPSAYALVRNAIGELAIVRTSRGFHLPGGGIESDETSEEAVEREAKEESGLILNLGACLGKAVQIVYSAEENACFEKISEFFEAKPIGHGAATEPDYELIWVDLDQAIKLLSHESHRWAVERLMHAEEHQYREDTPKRY